MFVERGKERWRWGKEREKVEVGKIKIKGLGGEKREKSGGEKKNDR